MLLNHNIAVRQHINWQSILKLMRMSFEHFVTHLGRLPQLSFTGIPLWKILTCIIFDRQMCIWEGCGQLLRFYREKNAGEKIDILSSISSSLTFLSENLWECYLYIFSTTETVVATWTNTRMHLPEKRFLGSACEFTQQKSIKAEQASEKTVLTAAHPA